jgi:hypothetical protein
MKKTVYILILIVSLINISSFKLNAQETDFNTIIINKYFQMSSQEKSDNENVELFNNNLISFSDSRGVSVLQLGNYNFATFKANSNNLQLEQIGNNNNYEFISFYGRDNLTFKAQQIGSNNYIQVLGENSIINNLSIIQKSDFKTITIVNY